MTNKEQKTKDSSYNTTFNIKNVGAVGGSGDNQKVNGKIIINTPTMENIAKPKLWYEKWWLKSLVISLICGLFTAYTFNSYNVGVFIFIISVIVVNFFNPIYRFWRAGFTALSIAAFNATPFLSTKIEFSKETLDGKIGFLLSGGDETNILSVALFLVIAIVLFILAYLEKKA